MEGTGELAQWIRELVALVEDLVSIPRTHMLTPNHLQLQFQGIRCPFLNSGYRWCIHTHIVKTLIHLLFKSHFKGGAAHFIFLFPHPLTKREKCALCQSHLLKAKEKRWSEEPSGPHGSQLGAGWSALPCYLQPQFCVLLSALPGR